MMGFSFLLRIAQSIKFQNCFPALFSRPKFLTSLAPEQNNKPFKPNRTEVN